MQPFQASQDYTVGLVSRYKQNRRNKPVSSRINRPCAKGVMRRGEERGNTRSYVGTGHLMFSLDLVHMGANTDSPQKADPLWKGSREGVYIWKKRYTHVKIP